MSAAEIHKWVDADGITHYSDEPPSAAESAVTRIDVEPRRGLETGSDYYSIANQWSRMHRERIERDRIRLEQDRLKSAQQAQTTKTEVVYIEKPAVETRYVTLPKRKWRRHHGHRGKAYRHGQAAGYGGQHRYRPQNSSASLGYFKPLQ